MRSDLKAAGGLEIETDLDEQTCSFKIDSSVKLTDLLDELAVDNDKIDDWEFIE